LLSSRLALTERQRVAAPTSDGSLTKPLPSRCGTFERRSFATRALNTGPHLAHNSVSRFGVAESEEMVGTLGHALQPARLPAPSPSLPEALEDSPPSGLGSRSSRRTTSRVAVGMSSPPLASIQAVDLDERGSLVEASEPRVFLATTLLPQPGTREWLSCRNAAGRTSPADDFEGEQLRGAAISHHEAAFGELSSRTLTPGEPMRSTSRGEGLGSTASVLRDSEARKLGSRQSFRL
jgi:hypothetical protein